MRKKYKLTRETKKFLDGTVPHCIRAVRDFVLVDGTKIRAGDLSGWVENKENLSHNDEVWVGDDAQVFEDARVYEKALVHGKAQVCGEARVHERAQVFS